MLAHRGGATFAIAGKRTCNLPPRAALAHIELDIQKARNRTVVILRDETLDRTTTGNGRVADHSLADLRSLHLS